MKFQIYREGARFATEKPWGDWRWRLVARNGRIIADSGEGYKRIAGCLNGIRLMRTGAVNAKIEKEEVRRMN